jgi:hypothetical protein
MDSANWQFGRAPGLFGPRTMLRQSFRRCPRMVALLLAAGLALPSARADGWQGGGNRGNQGWGGGHSSGNQGGYRGGGNTGGYQGGNGNNFYGGRYSGGDSFRGNGYQGGNYYGGGYHGGGYHGGGYRPAYGNRPAYGYGNRPAYGVGRPYAWNGGWNRGWQNGGYWGYRPWTTGWYNWAPNSWSWWGPSAVGWGVMGLATGAVITGLVNNAAQNQTTVIVVPDTTIRLDFASVLPSGDGIVSFRYIVGTTGPAYQGNGDCRQGLFNGQAPRSVAEAQLLNTTCHVAYGNGSNRAPAAANYGNGVPATPSYGNAAPVAPSYGNGAP